MIPTESVKKFRAVRIIHDDVHRIDFSYLAEFFRFMGVFVCEDILVEYHEKTKAECNTQYSAHIYVGTNESSAMLENAIEWKNIDDLYKKYIPESSRVISLYGDVMDIPTVQEGQNICSTGMLYRLERERQKAVLVKLLEYVLDTIYDGAAEQERIVAAQLESLIDTFVDGKLWFHSLNLQYFKKQKSDAAKDAKSAFLYAHKKVKAAQEKRAEHLNTRDGVQHIYDYALLWCEVKTNSACDYCNDILFFLIEKLAKRCKALCEAYPWFSNAKVLLGLCYEPSANSVNEAVWAFDDALNDIKAECFAAPVYYWVGKRYEPYKNKREAAKRSYTLANQCKGKFRNDFKLAVYARSEEAYEEAVKLFQKIPKGLKVKEAIRFVDPLEIEYLFKAYTQLCYIYHKKEEYIKAIEMGEKVVDIVDKYIEYKDSGKERPDDYFMAFYGEQREAYRNILRKRLDASTAYKLLADCYIKIFEPEKAKKYRSEINSIGR